MFLRKIEAAQGSKGRPSDRLLSELQELDLEMDDYEDELESLHPDTAKRELRYLAGELEEFKANLAGRDYPKVKQLYTILEKRIKQFKTGKGKLETAPTAPVRTPNNLKALPGGRHKMMKPRPSGQLKLVKSCYLKIMASY